MNINSKYLINVLFTILLLFIGASFINLMLFLVLPKQTIEYKADKSYRFPYRNYEYKKLFTTQKVNKVVKPQNSSSYSLLSRVELNAVYAKLKGKGWIVLKERSSQKTYILAQGEEFKNYKLKEVYKDYVLFEQNKKIFKVVMKKDKLNYNINKGMR